MVVTGITTDKEKPDDMGGLIMGTYSKEKGVGEKPEPEMRKPEKTPPKKPQPQKTLTEIKDVEKKLDNLDRAVGTLEAVSVIMMILFSIALFVALYSVADEYLITIFAEVFKPRTGQSILVLFILSSAILCTSIIMNELRQYMKDRKTKIWG